MHLFGTGHSRIPVEEMFPRYGSFPGFNPIVELSMTYHTQVVGSNGQRQAMFIERTPGLAEVILDNFSFGGHDVMMVFSANGLTAVPGGDGPRGAPARPQGHRRHLGRAVAGRASRTRPSAAGSSTRPTSSSTCARRRPTPWSRLEGLDTPVGPGSTLAYVAIVNALKVRIAQLLVERGHAAAGHHARLRRGRGALAGALRERLPGARPTCRADASSASPMTSRATTR